MVRNGKEPRIFLSYTHKDQDKVKSLYEKLRDSGFNPWMDKNDLIQVKSGNWK